MNTLTIALDVAKYPSVTPVVRVGAGDDGTVLEVSVLDHGAALTVSSYDASLLMRFDDGTVCEIAGTTSGSKATFTISAVDLPPGRTGNAYVSLDGSSFVLSTARFEFEVLAGAEV